MRCQASIAPQSVQIVFWYNQYMGDHSEYPPTKVIDVESVEDPQVKGLRILARIIARKITRQNAAINPRIDLPLDDSPEPEDNL
jgi:hypothetical protein